MKDTPYHFNVKMGNKWVRMTANAIEQAERKMHRKLKVRF